MNEWEDFINRCNNCEKCGLSVYRKNVVIGRGTPKPCPLMFIGEGPGEQEDIQGEAFVGRAGKLLDLLLTALEFDPSDYYIANIVKCRPPENRIPTQDEVSACLPWLRFQVKYIKPSILVCLGATAAKAIIDRDLKITQVRGTCIEKGGYVMIPTYHPAAVLRDNSKRLDFFRDMKLVKEKLSEIKQR
ncbi:MAG: uracil-DNA glycosylase [Clostridiaceae bacterium]|nr:uracil-DNA glycosylase [Clostridiaceae bacterium]